MPGRLVGDPPGGTKLSSTRIQLRNGLRVSIASIAWTVVASAAEVFLGLTHHVLTLVVFGAAGILDAAGSATLVVHFRHALRHDVVASHHERRATIVVSTGLVVLGLVTLVESGRRLASGDAGQSTAAGTVIAAMSVVVLATLATAKRRIGRQVGSTALVADGWLSTSGAVLGIVAVIGAALGSRPGWWWVDPVGALVIAAVATVYGTVVLVQEQRRHRSSRQPG